MSETAKWEIISQTPDREDTMYGIRDASGNLFTILSDRKKAELIVRAVNCHDRLLKWVKLLREVHRARGVMGVSKEWGEFEALIAEAEGGGNESED